MEKCGILVSFYYILELVVVFDKKSSKNYFILLSHSLQKFKLTIANTVISQDNSSLQTMDTGQLLDLFTVDTQQQKENEKKREAETGKGKSSLKSILDNMGNLWDEEQYETEYNLDNFIETLK